MNSNTFLCPNCRADRLVLDDERLSCGSCGETFPLIDHIPILIAESRRKEIFEYEGKSLSIEEMQRIYDRAYEQEELMGTDLDEMYDRTTKEKLLQFGGLQYGARVLDVGTGIGNLWRYLDVEVEGHALDLSLQGIKQTQRRHPKLTVSVSIAETLPYADGYFDVVIAADTIEHTVAPQQALLEIHRVLTPGGILAASFPIPDSLRKWGWNQLFHGHMDFKMLFGLIRVLIKRTLIFGRPDFQPIDRDLEVSQWVSLVGSCGFEVVEVLEWPERPRLPIVTLVKAFKVV